jgi:hypothetical protein
LKIAPLRGILGAYIYECRRLDANGERADMHQPVVKFYTIGHGGQMEDSCTGGEEVPRIVVGVETNEVAVEYPE